MLHVISYAFQVISHIPKNGLPILAVIYLALRGGGERGDGGREYV